MVKQQRIAARAFIVEQDRVLFTQSSDRNGVYYVLPGGGQKAGEYLHDTLHRELQEELNVQVDIGRMIAMREFEFDAELFTSFPNGLHQVEAIFECRIVAGQVALTSSADAYIESLIWLPIEQLSKHRIYPDYRLIQRYKDHSLNPYLRD